MKRGSEDKVREALNEMDLDTWPYKPPDDARNWKPADYIVWWNDPDPLELLSIANTVMLEVKDTPAVNVFNLREIRPSQRNAIMRCMEMGIPYLIVIFWRRKSRWTISDGVRIFREEDPPRSLTYTQLSSKYGVEARPELLAATLRSVLVDHVV